MIDFHSHILPGIDDGASDVETSIGMLKISALSGVNTVVATSHCYLSESNSIEKFFKNRICF